MTARSLIFLTLVGAFLAGTLQADTYTYPQLVNRMTDLPALAQLPPPGEKTALASSYGRASQYDAATDKYIKWDSNSDNNGIIRQEGDESVFMDVQGPGCIWRMWAATAVAGHVKIYLDGSSTPAVDLPFVGYFDGKTPPFNRPNLVYSPSAAVHGWDNYTPVPFQKSCKIVADKDWGALYQFTYTLFPAGTLYAVEAFWYLKAGGTDPYPSVPVADRVGYWVRPEIYHEPDAIGGGSLHSETKSVARFASGEMWKYGKGWSNDHQLIWAAAHPGDTLGLALPTQRAGRYRLGAHYTRGPDYGTFQVSLNGTDTGRPTDFYGPEATPMAPVDLGIVTLPEGAPIFKVTFTGKNPAATGSKFGLDYLKLIPAP